MKLSQYLPILIPGYDQSNAPQIVLTKVYVVVHFHRRWHEAKGLVQCGAVAGLSNTGADCSVVFSTLVNFLGRWQGDDFVLA